MKTIVMDPIGFKAGADADEWIPILPATDIAVFLAMARIIVHDIGTYDKEYITTHSVGFDKFKAYVTGEEDDPPVKLAGSQAYMMASTYAAVASMVALWHSSISGKGQHVDISVEEATVSVSHICGVGKWLDDGIVPRRRGSGLFASVPSGAYPCSDGMIYLMINRPLHWQALARWINEVTGNQEVLDPMFEGPSSQRQPYRELLDLYISELTSRFTVAELYHEGQRRHIALTPVNGAPAVARDEHLVARRYFVEVEHRIGGALAYPGAPYRHSATPWRIVRPAPDVGEHNREIYAGELGVSQEELRSLASSGVI